MPIHLPDEELAKIRFDDYRKPAFVITTIVQITIHADSEEEALEKFKRNPLTVTFKGNFNGQEYWSGVGQIVSIKRKESHEQSRGKPSKSEP